MKAASKTIQRFKMSEMTGLPSLASAPRKSCKRTFGAGRGSAAWASRMAVRRREGRRGSERPGVGRQGGLRQQTELFAELDGLRSALGAEFVKGTAAVGLDRVLTDEELAGDLAVAHALRDEFQDLEFAAGDAEIIAFALVGNECGGGERRYSGDTSDGIGVRKAIRIGHDRPEQVRRLLDSEREGR